MANLPPLPLPNGIAQRYIDLTSVGTCGLKIFLLEAGDRNDPLIFLFHGYPELAYTWRKVILPLAAKGYHVVAPDSRGYGRTTGWDTSSYAYTNLSQFTSSQLVLDNLALMRALGHQTAACVVGHDFGANAASACALTRPDLFKAAVFMGHVPPGAEALPPLNPTSRSEKPEGKSDARLPRDPDVHTSLAQRDPAMKHYQWYNSTASAAHDWENPPQGLRAFLRGYVHLKSHKWKGHGDIGRLTGWTADQLARMPEYYIMPISSTMPGIVMENMRTEDESLTTAFVTDEELDVYVSEFERTGFQGMLNWYRSSTDPRNLDPATAIFAGRKFDVPTTYISGAADWGNYQRPGALEGFETGTTASDYRGTKIFEGAGHWPQTEVPDIVCQEVLKFLDGHW